MERLTLDMEGARSGELLPASLQFGNDTIAIQRIATMSVEAHEFAPFDTPRNQQAKGLLASTFVGCLFFAMLALAYWGLMPAAPNAQPALFVGGGLGLAAVFLAGKALQYAIRLKKRVPYYRLMIGTSDGRQIPLVDNDRGVLVKIRDVVRHKLDTDDRSVTGHFDLNLDTLYLDGAEPELPEAAALEDKRAPEPVSEAEEDDQEAPAILFGEEEVEPLKDAS